MKDTSMCLWVAYIPKIVMCGTEKDPFLCLYHVPLKLLLVWTHNNVNVNIRVSTGMLSLYATVKVDA